MNSKLLLALGIADGLFLAGCGSRGSGADTPDPTAITSVITSLSSTAAQPSVATLSTGDFSPGTARAPVFSALPGSITSPITSLPVTRGGTVSFQANADSSQNPGTNTVSTALVGVVGQSGFYTLAINDSAARSSGRIPISLTIAPGAPVGSIPLLVALVQNGSVSSPATLTLNVK